LDSLWDQLPDNRYYHLLKNIALDIGPSGDAPSNLLALPRVEASVTSIARNILRLYEDKTDGHLVWSNRTRDRRWLMTLAHMVDHAKAFARGIQCLDTLCKLDISDEDLKDEINEAQTSVAQAFRPWTHSNVIELIWNNQIPRRNLALIGALAEITGEKQPLLGVVSRIQSDGTRIDTILDPLFGSEH
jgi:hypothetical protein